MAAQNTIELGFNVEELTAEKKVVLDLLTDLFQQLEKYDGTRFNPLGNGGLTQLKKSLVDGAAAMQEFLQKAENYNKVVTEQYQKQQQVKKTTDELTNANKQGQDAQTALNKEVEKGNFLQSEQAKQIAIQKELNKDRQKQINAEAREAAGLNDAYKKLELQYIAAAKEAKNLAATPGTPKEAIDEANAKAKALSDELKSIDAAVGQHQRNVGNYTGALQILETELTRVREEIAKTKAAQTNLIAAGPSIPSANQNRVAVGSARGPQEGDIQAVANYNAQLQKTSATVADLERQEQLLNTIVQGQQRGFGSLVAEIRGTERALFTMQEAGLQNTEAFKAMQEKLADVKRDLKEFRDTQKLLSAEMPGVAAMTLAVKGLAGAYAIGAGAASLLANGDEKVEKELNKLVAVMTVLQGLQEVHELLEKKGTVAKIADASATKLLNTAKEIEIRLFGQSTKAAIAETEAKVINTEAQEANAGAQEASAAGAEVNTLAMEETTVATEEATVATYSFTTALISTGIGAILIGIIYGVTKLVGAIDDWITADERAEEAQKSIIETTEQLIETTKELDEAYRYFGKERIENLQKQADLQKSAGVNEFIALNNEKAIIEERLSQAKKLIDQKKIDQNTVDELHQREIDGLEIIKGYQETLAQAQADYAKDDSGENKARIERLKEVIDGEKNRTKVVTEEYNIQFNALKEKRDAEKDLEDNRIKTAKAAFDELAKITADIARRRYDIIKDGNDRILNLDKSTEDERFAALASNYQAEASLNNSQVEAVRKQLAAKYITEADAGNQLANLRSDLNIKYKKYLDDQEKLRIEYGDRELNAQNSISKSRNESDAAVQEAITKDVQRDLQDRLDALKKNIDDKTKVIIDDYNLQVRLAREHGKTETEIQALAEERDKNLAALTAATQKEIYDTVISYGEKRIKAIQDENKAVSNANQVSSDYNKDTDKLNQALIDRKISYDKYLADKKKLDEKYAIEKDKADIKDDEAALQRLQDYLQKELNLKIFFAEKELEAAKKTGNEKEIADAQAQLNALLDLKRKEAAEEVAITAKLEKDKTKLHADQVKPQEEIDALLNDRKKQIEQQSYELSKNLIDASFENRINKIQQQIDKTNEQAQAEVDAVTRSSLAQQDKEAELVIIQANEKARNTQLQKEQKAEKVKEAKFDRDVALAEVAWSTAQAVMKDTKNVPWPYDIEVAAADIALGAIQAAAILAKPIPTYGEGVGIPGKGRHPGGLGWVGELYEPELVKMPGQKPFITDKPLLLDMPADTIVSPLNADDIVWDLGWAGMMYGNALINNRAETQDRVVEAINAQTAQMKRAYAQQSRKIQNIVNVHIDADWSNYVNKKIIGKA